MTQKSVTRLPRYRRKTPPRHKDPRVQAEIDELHDLGYRVVLVNWQTVQPSTAPITRGMKS